MPLSLPSRSRRNGRGVVPFRIGKPGLGPFQAQPASILLSLCLGFLGLAHAVGPWVGRRLTCRSSPLGHRKQGAWMSVLLLSLRRFQKQKGDMQAQMQMQMQRQTQMQLACRLVRGRLADPNNRCDTPRKSCNRSCERGALSAGGSAYMWLDTWLFLRESSRTNEEVGGSGSIHVRTCAEVNCCSTVLMLFIV